MHCYFFINQVYFWVCCSLCAGLYLKTICFLRGHKDASSHSNKGRMDTLSNIFAVIALAWILCECPYAVFNLLDYPVWVHSGCNDMFFQRCNPRFCGKLRQVLRLTRDGTFMLKNLFPLLNTLLLVALLRSLHMPLRRCLKLICRK